MSCARSKGTKGIEREGKRNKDGSLLLNMSTHSHRKRNTRRKRGYGLARSDTLEGDVK